MLPGVPCADAPLEDVDGRATWLLKHVGGGPTALVFCDVGPGAAGVARAHAANPIPDLRVVVICKQGREVPGATTLVDRDGIASARYGGAPGVTYLIRPDQHVLGRWSQWDPDALRTTWRNYLWGAGE